MQSTCFLEMSKAGSRTRGSASPRKARALVRHLLIGGSLDDEFGRRCVFSSGSRSSPSSAWVRVSPRRLVNCRGACAPGTGPALLMPASLAITQFFRGRKSWGIFTALSVGALLAAASAISTWLFLESDGRLSARFKAAPVSRPKRGDDRASPSRMAGDGAGELPRLPKA